MASGSTHSLHGSPETAAHRLAHEVVGGRRVTGEQPLDHCRLDPVRLAKVRHRLTVAPTTGQMEESDRVRARSWVRRADYVLSQLERSTFRRTSATNRGTPQRSRAASKE